jgi:hypothetical protein
LPRGARGKVKTEVKETIENMDIETIVISVITVSVSIIAVAITYVDMRKRLKQEEKFSKSMANLINTLREELELFRKQSMTSEEIKKQELLFKREQQQWKQITDIGKVIGWAIKQAQNEEAD